jgi:hypothetical protein
MYYKSLRLVPFAAFWKYVIVDRYIDFSTQKLGFFYASYGVPYIFFYYLASCSCILLLINDYWYVAEIFFKTLCGRPVCVRRLSLSLVKGPYVHQLSLLHECNGLQAEILTGASLFTHMLKICWQKLPSFKLIKMAYVLWQSIQLCLICFLPPNAIWSGYGTGIRDGNPASIPTLLPNLAPMEK